MTRFLTYRNQSIDLHCKSVDWSYIAMNSVMKEFKKSCGTILPLKDGIFGFEKKMVYETFIIVLCCLFS